MYIRRGKSNFFVYCKITDFDYIDFDKCMFISFYRWIESVNKMMDMLLDYE